MALYGPNFSMMFLNHLFLYKGVYCTIRIVIRTFIMDTCEIYIQVTQPCKNYLEAYTSVAKPSLTWRLVNLFQTFFNKMFQLINDILVLFSKVINCPTIWATYGLIQYDIKKNSTSKHATRNLPNQKRTRLQFLSCTQNGFNAIGLSRL